MEDFVESIQSAPRAKRTLSAVHKLLEGTVTGKALIKNKTWLNEIPLPGHALLLHLGFKKVDGVWIWDERTSTPGVHPLADAAELIECVLLSMDDDMPDAAAAVDGAAAPPAGVEASSERPGGQPSAVGAPTEDEDDDELNAALALSLGEGDGHVAAQKHKRRRGGSHPGDRDDDEDDLMGDDEPRVSVDFQRFDAENVVIDPKQVEEVNTIQEQLGEPYVDPQFPATDNALYFDPADANSWTCGSCGKRNPMPPLFPPPTTREEAISLQGKLDSVLCGFCRAKPTNVSQVRFVHRPASWLRPSKPGFRDDITEMLFPTVTDNSLKSRLCCAYLRDDMGNTLGQEWAVVRHEARPEDVVQGAIGNCWFAGALSVVAQRPDLIDKLILTKKYNRHGAYLVQLNHAGRWRGMLIDDLFPCSKPWEGRVEGGKIYFAQGGELSYLQSRRRQLWVPLLEKAAAKLFGCYAALNSGTFGEALGLLTGYPVETMPLYTPKHVVEARKKRRDEIANLRMMALLRGHSYSPQDGGEEEEFVLDDGFQQDLLWTRLLSYYEAGYLMGLACSAEAVEKTKEEVVATGLQSPHAYGILEVREISAKVNDPAKNNCSGGLLPKDAAASTSTTSTTAHRLIKIRNPWGERAPQTWKGAWGSEWEGWTRELKLELGVINASNVKMHEDMGIFWIDFENLRRYFGQVQVCRVHPPFWLTLEERVWLTSFNGGPGEYLEFDCYQNTEVDLSVWQERHVKREASIGAKSTNQDVGFVLLKKRTTGPRAEKKDEVELSHYEDFRLVQTGKRTRQDHTSIDTTIEGGFTYCLVPLSFSLLQDEGAFPRQGNVVLHANHKVSALRKKKSSWELIDVGLWHMLDAGAEDAAGQALRVKKVPLQDQFTGKTYANVKTCFVREEAGYIMAVENHSSTDAAGVQYDMTESVGITGSRLSAVTFDVIPPRKRFIVNIGTQRSVADFVDYSLGMQYVDPEVASTMQTPLSDFHRLTDIPDTVLLLPPEEDDPNKNTSSDRVSSREAARENFRKRFRCPDEELLKQSEGDDVFNGHKVEKAKPLMEGGTSSAGGCGAAAAAGATAAKNSTNMEVDPPEHQDPAGDEVDEEALLLEEAMRMSVDPKIQLQTRIKQLFTEYTTGADPMAPNAAAAKAMQVAQQEQAARLKPT